MLKWMRAAATLTFLPFSWMIGLLKADRYRPLREITPPGADIPVVSQLRKATKASILAHDYAATPAKYWKAAIFPIGKIAAQ